MHNITILLCVAVPFAIAAVATIHSGGTEPKQPKMQNDYNATTHFVFSLLVVLGCMLMMYLHTGDSNSWFGLIGMVVGHFYGRHSANNKCSQQNTSTG